MLRRTDFRGRRVLIFGLGLHGGGVSAARWFAGRGAIVGVTDLRPARELAPSLVQLRGLIRRRTLGRNTAEDIRWAELVVVNPGALRSRLVALARRLGKQVVTDVGLFFGLCPVPIVGVTGTKGKSTTAALVTAFLRTHFRGSVLLGNIGVGVLDGLPRLRAPAPAVLELSSWQLEGLREHAVAPHVALLTNVLPDHLNRYRSFAAYAAAKRDIFRFQRPGDVAILNLDDPLSGSVRPKPDVRVRTYSLRRRSADAYVSAGAFWIRTGRRTRRFARLTDLQVPGRHNQAAVLAAALAAVAAGAEPHRLAVALRAFRGLPGRLQSIRRRRGVTWVNDTAATDPAATVAALEATAGGIVLIAGGEDKRLSYGGLARELTRRARQTLLLPGSASEKLWRAARRRASVEPVATVSVAVRRAARIARPGETVLFSPGAASFNQFLHEFERGQAFERAVRRLP